MFRLYMRDLGGRPHGILAARCVELHLSHEGGPLVDLQRFGVCVAGKFLEHELQICGKAWIHIRACRIKLAQPLLSTCAEFIQASIAKPRTGREELLQQRAVAQRLRSERPSYPCPWLTTTLRREGLVVFPGTRSPPSGSRCRAPFRQPAARGARSRHRVPSASSPTPTSCRSTGCAGSGRSARSRRGAAVPAPSSDPTKAWHRPREAC